MKGEFLCLALAVLHDRERNRLVDRNVVGIGSGEIGSGQARGPKGRRRLRRRVPD
jgi:hypothetical protein